MDNKIIGAEVELWKDINGYEGLYQISSLSNLKSLARPVSGLNGGIYLIKEKILKTSPDGWGYLKVSLNINGKSKTRKIHQLVCEAFLTKKDPLHEVNHIDGNKKNNRLTNLEYISRSENIKHAFANGLLLPHGKVKDRNSAKYTTKLTETDVVAILKSNQTDKQLASSYNVSIRNINSIKNRKSWQHLTV